MAKTEVELVVARKRRRLVVQARKTLRTGFKTGLKGDKKIDESRGELYDRP